MLQVNFVTKNPHKVQDAQKLLTKIQLCHKNIELPEIQSLDPKEIINFKLQTAFKKIQQPCFVMDTSLYLDCLNGFPGPLIKWFFEQVGDHKICQICRLLQNQKCHYKTILGYFDGEKSHFFEEYTEGTIANEPRGTNGFDWDTIFVPEGHNLTFAEMTFEQKQQFAVTAKLLLKLENFLLDK